MVGSNRITASSPSGFFKSSTMLRLPRLRCRYKCPMPRLRMGPTSRMLSPSCGFDFDHIGAEFGEDLRGEWTHHHRGEVEDFYSG